MVNEENNEKLDNDSIKLLLSSNQSKNYKTSGCFEKLRTFFSKNNRLIAKRRLTTDKDGNPIGSKMREIHPDNIKRL